jgi:hypothetical protein
MRPQHGRPSAGDGRDLHRKHFRHPTKPSLTEQGEHGIGLGKKDALFEELGLDTINVMRSIKQSLDPFWLMNPGKIFEAVQAESTRDEWVKAPPVRGR